jgi:hypothetical protein
LPYRVVDIGVSFQVPQGWHLTFGRVNGVIDPGDGVHCEHLPSAVWKHIDRDLLGCVAAGVARRRCLRAVE